MPRIELLGLDQHFFAHADLAEVVQQRCVANFLHLLAGEARARVGAGVAAVDGFRQTHGKRGDAEAVAGGGGVALLDGRHRGFHEAFEQCLDVQVELAVFVSHRRLRSE